MPDTESRFFELADHHGRDYADNLEPLVEIGTSIALPVMKSHPVTGSPVITSESQRVVICPAEQLTDSDPGRIIPNTRIVETANPLVAGALLGCGQYVEIDAPTKARIAQHEKETRAHVAALEARDKQVQAGNEPEPDAGDTPPTIDEQPVMGEEG
jgi:hypothetical protein